MCCYEKPLFTEGNNKTFTINYYYEGGTEVAYPSDEVSVASDGTNVQHQLPEVEGASVVDGTTEITLVYKDGSLVNNIYYKKDTQTNATVKVNLEFVNANGKTVVEAFEFELPVGSLTSTTVSDVLAMKDVAKYIASQIEGDFTSFLSTDSGYANIGIKNGKPFADVISGKIEIAQTIVK